MSKPKAWRGTVDCPGCGEWHNDIKLIEPRPNTSLVGRFLEFRCPNQNAEVVERIHRIEGLREEEQTDDALLPMP